MKYSIKIVKNSLTEDHKNDSLWVRCIVRNISFPITILFLYLGCSAWFVSMLSAIIAFIGCILLCVNNNLSRWIGVMLIHIWIILDCVDGNIARIRKTQGPKGEFIDALSGYIISSFCFLATGVAAFFTTKFFSQIKEVMLICGAVASISNILPRLIYQKYKVCNYEIEKRSDCNFLDKKLITNEGVSNFHKIRNRIGKEIGLSGLFMPGLIIVQVFYLYDIFTVFTYYFVQ